MNRTRVAAAGGLTFAAAAIVATAMLLPGSQPEQAPDSTPAGQVEQVNEPPAPTPTTTVLVVNEPPAQDAPPANEPPAGDSGDTGDVNQQPAVEIPEVAPGNPLGDFEQRPDPAPPVDHQIEQPAEDPIELNTVPLSPSSSEQPAN